ncbi:Glucan endo-1,3-beta-glucosidase A1 precursor [Novipirellula aureliae]|uniref:Glucan endo-1,3-beta-glucosidase A1 n=1 Tax=Novipirellula aureliae TaxID=2527966 RepID=A0A5C6EAR3_9BACT|nr:glycoside hydrolase family 16 protein [Novipirellula aureliae]TWU45584.1 Glucan endo-1,3-beta-glucosidase A1 precursor [Novipirellula aureliae]
MRISANSLSITLLGCCCLLPANSSAQEAVLDAKPASLTYSQLVWSDEFEGEELDRSKWSIEVNAFGGGNQELQIYTDRQENVRVEDGNLVIEARNDKAAVSGTEREYSSGRVRTKKRGDWKYGRIDVRAKVPAGKGIWSAIWMLPTDEKYGGWAASGEIDIMEMRGQDPNIVLGTLHYGDNWPRNTHSGDQYKLEAGSFADDFHVFSIVWKPGQIDWLIDGKRYQTQTKWSTAGADFPAPFDQEFHLLLNVAVGGNFLGSPDATTEFPRQMQVDYVRVYQ